MSETDYENVEIVVETVDTASSLSVGNISNKTPKKNDERIYHSSLEKRLVEDLLQTPLSEIRKEVDNMIVVQHIDKQTNTPTFNATYTNVVIKDEDGKRKLINNKTDMRNQHRVNREKDNPTPIIIPTKPSIPSTEDEFDFE